MPCINIPGMGTRLLCLILSTVKKLAFDDIQKVAIKRCWPNEKHDNHWTCGALGSFVSELVTIPTGVFLFFLFYFFYDGWCWQSELGGLS